MSGNAHQRRLKQRARDRALPPVFRGVASLWQLADRLEEPESGALLGPRTGVLPPYQGPREGGPRCPWCGGTESEHHYHSPWGDPEYGCLDEQALGHHR